MADTFESNLGIRLIETGAYENQWGAVLNSDALNFIAKAVTAESPISLTSTSYSLPAMGQGTDSVTRSFCLGFDGSPGGAVTVTVPASVVRKFYLIDNRCGQAITFTYGSGSTATVAAGEKRFIWCNGTSVSTPSATASDAATLDGIGPSQFARRDQSNVFSGGRNSSRWVDINEQPTTTIDASVGNHQRLSLTGNRNIAIPDNPVDGQELWLQVRQDASGGRTLNWASIFIFENGIPPTLASSPSGADLFLMIYDAAATQWIVGHFGSIASASGATANITIESNQVDWNLAAVLGAVATPLTLTITIARGVILSAGSPGSYAMDLANALPSGSTLNLVNLGYILGRGGDGGNGNAAHTNGSGNHAWNVGCTNGFDGGPALRGPGLGITWNVTNGSGFIWGGGGGGGGGASTVTGNGGAGCGGGGGGGAGGGGAGRGGSVNNTTRAGNGVGGSSSIGGAAGSGGTTSTSGSASAGAGGAGGDWGTAGSAGANDGAGGTGGNPGAAGKAVELNSGAANFLSGNGAPNIKGAVS